MAVVRSRSATAAKSGMQAALLADVAERLREEGRPVDARFFDQLSGIHGASAAIKHAVQRETLAA